MTATTVGRSCEGRYQCRKQGTETAQIQLQFAQIQLQIHYVITLQAGHKETKHLSKNKPHCHITHDDHDYDDDDDNHLVNLPDTLLLKRRVWEMSA